MKYAVVKISSLQYKVNEGSKIEVEKLPFKEGEEVELKDLLMIVEDNKVKIGRPILKGASVKAKVLKHFLGKKLDVFKFKAKTGYRRKIGFRPAKTALLIEKITS